MSEARDPTRPDMSRVVKVKRDGPRGWHWIGRHRFDPAIHELYEDPGSQPPKRKPGRPRKHTQE